MGARLILWAIVFAVFAALYAPLILKAGNQLRSYRPDPFRAASAPGDDEISHSVGIFNR